MKNVVVFGGNGFIGHHLARRLKKEGNWVRTVDINQYTFGDIDYTDDYIIGDLREKDVIIKNLLKEGKPIDELYVLSSWMGGAGVIFTGKFDDEIMYNSLTIDLNSAKYASELGVGKVFFSSSACAYNADLQQDANNMGLKESCAYPANPDSDYGFAKLTSERVYQAFNRNKGLNIRIARFHNVFGQEGSWNNDKEKFPAAVTRKVCEAKDGDSIEIWGTGNQTRSFIYIDEAVDGVLKLMESDYTKPINIGSSEMISVNDLAKMVIEISGKNLTIKNVESNAIGVMGRNSDNTLIKEVLDWTPTQPLRKGMESLYSWINKQVSC
jgi:nucleoside-diphosphate-sugar epimerase